MDPILKLKAEPLAGESATPAQTLDDRNGLLRTLRKSALERMRDSERDVPLGRKTLAALPGDEPESLGPPAPQNRRPGHSHKTVRGDLGERTLDTPRDRHGTFAPPLSAKHPRRLTGCEEKILTLYAKGMTTRDLPDVVQELYGVAVSPTLVSEITADLEAEVTAWRPRRLEAVWPIVSRDGIVVHVRGANGRVAQHTMYVAIGVHLLGKKELLGLWRSATEGAKFWLRCLTDLKNRGLKDSFLVCVDGRTGFPAALRTAYPQTKVQLCIVHLVRAALQYVTDKDSRAVAADLQKMYPSATVLEAEQELAKFAAGWGQKYPTLVKQWRRKWSDSSALLEFPPPIRKAIYPTKALASVNSVLRKFTRNRKQYPNAESALKLVYLAIHEASQRWTMPIAGWKAAWNHFAIVFEDRLHSVAKTE